MSGRPRLLAPSLLAADPGRLADQMEQAARGGADWWHLDVMDGHFVPNLSFGPHFCEGLRRHTLLPFDVHLMVLRPSLFVEPFLRAGASTLSLHVETEDPPTLAALLRTIRAAGARPSVTLRPDTPLDRIRPYVKQADMVLLMSVEPGYGGQALLPEALDRARALRALLDRENPACLLQMDGGLTLENTGDALAAGVDVVVAGSAVFEAPDIAGRCRDFARILRF